LGYVGKVMFRQSECIKNNQMIKITGSDNEPLSSKGQVYTSLAFTDLSYWSIEIAAK